MGRAKLDGISTLSTSKLEFSKDGGDSCEIDPKALLAGFFAAAINTSIMFPVNKLIFRQMMDGYKALFVADQMKAEGK